MTTMFHVSLQNTEKELINWITERQKNNEISPSLVFRDAMIQKKKDWEIEHSENPRALHERFNQLKEVIGNIQDFITENKLNEELLKWREKNPVENKVIEIVESKR